MSQLESAIVIHRSPEDVFDFHDDPRNLPRILPPYLRLELTDAPDRLSAGVLLHCDFYVGPLRFDWIIEITDHAPPHRFVDVQKKGPFRQYTHTHIFQPQGRWTRLIDRIDYELPAGPFAELASRIGLQNRLQEVIEYGQRTTKKLLERARPAGTRS